MTIPHTIEREGVAIKVDCEFALIEGERGSRNSYGAPETPDVPDELEFIAATIGAIEIQLTETEIKAATHAAWKQINQVNL